MKRREFLKGSLLASALAGLGASTQTSAAAESKAAEREIYELRAYRLAPGADHKLLDTYLEKAAIPALNRLGVKSVGVFTEIEPAKGGPAVYVLVPHASINSFLTAATQIGVDPEYQKAGAEYLGVAKTSPAFQRIDSWLMLAFAGMPRMELPSYCRDKKARVFEMRTYQSHSESKAQKKVDMFNAGEIEVMREVGLGPVFYGQTLLGCELPHLIYMTSAENKEAHKKHWEGFRTHPIWKKLQADAQYKDSVSKITSYMLEPAPYSQI